LNRRIQLVEIARKYDLLIVEDDPYGALRYEGEDITPIAQLAPERTLYLGTFSKTLTPGLRLGWVVAPTEIIARLVQTKQGVDLHTSTLDQMIAYSVVASGVLPEHVEELRKKYGERRDTMIDAMVEFWPEECTWTRPQGGLFLWACLPDGIDAVEMLKVALKNKVAYVPGINFFPYSDGGNYSMRLNFSNAQPDMIVEGIRRLGTAIKDAMVEKSAVM
jgi:2-aminoadipate transaminase